MCLKLRKNRKSQQRKRKSKDDPSENFKLKTTITELKAQWKGFKSEWWG